MTVNEYTANVVKRFPWQCDHCGHHTDRHIYGGPGFEECRDCGCAGYVPPAERPMQD